MRDAARQLLRGALAGAGLSLAWLLWVWLGAAASPSPLAGLEAVRLAFPVPAALGAELAGHFAERRGPRLHAAVDIAAPRGSPVVAVADGVVVRLSSDGAAGRSLDLVAADARHCYFYAHLDAWAPGLAEDQRVRRGDPLGVVGTTGNAPSDAPHLHFAVRRLGSGQGCWQGEPVDPAPLLRPPG